MKKILFLIFGLMSFTASADMERLWVQMNVYMKTEAWCIFENEDSYYGSTYLYIYHQRTPERNLVQPLFNADSNTVKGCYRPSRCSVADDGKTYCFDEPNYGE